MPKINLITGLDIGTGGIKILVAAKNQDGSDLEVMYQAKEPSLA